MDLDNSERRFQMLVKCVTDYAIYMLDPTGIVVSWNAGAERIKGYTVDEIIGDHFSRFYTEQDREAGRPRAALRIAETEGRYEEEGWRVRKDGQRLWANVVIDPVRDDDGTLIGFAKVTRDITEKKELERQLIQAQKMEAVGQLTGGLAHDFNNILSVVIGNLDTVVEGLDEQSTIKPAASDALDAAIQGAELVHHLLAFSRNQTLQPKQLDLGNILSATEPLMRRSLGERIEIETGVGEGIWPVMADPSQLESLILNLAINARDAMPDGGRLSIRCLNVSLDEHQARQEQLAQSDYVVLTVSDNGSGIAPEVLPRVFEPFYTTKEVGKGSGLGLSMVYGFARQSGGTAKIYSEIGHGTEVRVYLPRAIEETVPASAELTSAETVPTGAERILVVEDNANVRKTAVNTLTSLGYRTFEADCAAAALALVDQRMEFDLLFTDLVMPGEMNGMDLAWAVRRRRPEMPIVITSGFSDPDIVSGEMKALGATLIAKPCRKSALARHLRSSLDRSLNRSAA